MPGHPNREVALRHAAAGLFVFPVNSEKIPCERGWQTSASNDREAVNDLWKRWPNALVGIACGPSCIVVIDCDRHGGPDGVAAFGEIAGDGDYQPLVHTPSDGIHLYFLSPAGEPIRNSAGRLAPGIDVRGDGGYVVAPGSRLPDGREYRCDAFDLSRAIPLPDFIAARLREPRRSGRSKAFVHRDARPSRYAEAALAGEVDSVRRAGRGTRNDRLNIAALKLGHHVGAGRLDADCVTAELIAASHANGYIAEDGEAAARATIESGLRKGASEPSALPDCQSPDGPSLASCDGSGAAISPSDTIDLSHDALANELGRRRWDTNAKHVAGWAKWLFWTGTHWRLDDRLEHMTAVRRYLAGRADELLCWAERKAAALAAGEAETLLNWARKEGRLLRAKATVASIADLARSNARSVAVASDFDAQLMLLGTPGGIVDLTTGKLRPAQRGDMVTKQTMVAPSEPGVVADRWLRFLDEVFAGDRAIIAFIQRAVGYALTGLTTEHKLLFLYGTGRNGKSVFLDVLFRLWGDYARRAAAATFLNTQTERHPTDLAGLQGARLVVGSELPKGKTWDEAVIKDLTGGDKITARFMRQDFFDFTPQLTLMIAGNTQPSFRGIDEGIRSRVVLVPFTVTIPPEKRDRGLVDKLIAEGPAILRWAIDGALEWQSRGLDVPPAIAAASADYFDSEDTLGQFLADEIVIQPGAFSSASILHERFEQWCAKQGLSAWTRHTLVKELRTRGFVDGRSNGNRGLKGLRLR